MSRFKVTTYQWKEYPECRSSNDGYLVEALNPEDSEHLCLGHFEGIWGGKEDLIKYLKRVYDVNESELVFVDKEENTMTIQWKKLINFDVPQKLWDLAEKIANERGWTTEAVLCDAAEKYLGYIEEDPDNEMISIQIPKSLYDRIETVANKSVEREIQREMTEWVELVEEIYEDSDEEEESVEPLLPPVSDAPKESTQYYLVKYESDWADEMDIEGFDILTQEDKDYFESLIPTDDKPLIHYVGTNEEIEYWNSEMFLRCYTWTPITKEEAETVKRLFNPSYGHFYYPEIDDEEEDD